MLFWEVHHQRVSLCILQLNEAKICWIHAGKRDGGDRIPPAVSSGQHVPEHQCMETPSFELDGKPWQRSDLPDVDTISGMASICPLCYLPKRSLQSVCMGMAISTFKKVCWTSGMRVFGQCHMYIAWTTLFEMRKGSVLYPIHGVSYSSIIWVRDEHVCGWQS